MSFLRTSLLVRVVLTLAAVGLLPVAISFYQLRTNKDALLEQVQRTHVVAAQTSAARVDAFLAALTTVAATLADHPAIRTAPRSPEATELLAGVLRARPDVGAVGVFDPTGAKVVLAKRAGLGDELPELDVSAEADADSVPKVVAGRERRWIAVTASLPQAAGRVVLLADAAPLDATVAAEVEMGPEAVLVLVDGRSGEVLAGAAGSLAGFPAEVVESARGGKLLGAQKVKAAGGDLVLGFYPLQQAPWVVLSRQPARVAELAQTRVRRATWTAASLALAMTALLSLLAFKTVVQPLRRLVVAQRELLGETPKLAGGSEIAQLEEAFALLEQRVRDREDLGKVFLGRYQVVDVLGSGAMGTVFRGWDPKLERAVALKTVRLETEEPRREKLVATLLREAITSARFNHPNIVSVYDAADEGQAAFIAMELVDGITLRELLTARGQLEWREVVCLGAAIARGLAAAHQQGLVHQDVKPANVLLGRDGSIKVTDFGISQLISSATAEGMICGTPGYIAPESLEGGGYSTKSDLFALGVSLHESLTGEHPFAGRSLRVTILNTLTHDPPSVARLHPDMPPELGRLIDQLLDKNPDRRPADAGEVAKALDHLAARLELSWRLALLATSPPPPQESPARTEPAHFHTQLVSLELVPRTLPREPRR